VFVAGEYAFCPVPVAVHCCGKVHLLQIHDASIVADGENLLFNVDNNIDYAIAGSRCG